MNKNFEATNITLEYVKFGIVVDVCMMRSSSGM